MQPRRGPWSGSRAARRGSEPYVLYADGVHELDLLLDSRGSALLMLLSPFSTDTINRWLGRGAPFPSVTKDELVSRETAIPPKT